MIFKFFLAIIWITGLVICSLFMLTERALHFLRIVFVKRNVRDSLLPRLNLN